MATSRYSSPEFAAKIREGAKIADELVRSGGPRMAALLRAQAAQHAAAAFAAKASDPVHGPRVRAIFDRISAATAQGPCRSCGTNCEATCAWAQTEIIGSLQALTAFASDDMVAAIEAATGRQVRLRDPESPPAPIGSAKHALAAQAMVRDMMRRPASFVVEDDVRAIVRTRPDLVELGSQLAARSGAPDDITAGLMYGLWSWAWASHGMHIFGPTDTLLSSLLLTRFSGLRAGELRWPFDAFLVQLPPTLLRIDTPWGPNPVRCILACRLASRDGVAAGSPPRPCVWISAICEHGIEVHWNTGIAWTELPVEELLERDAGGADLDPIQSPMTGSDGATLRAAKRIVFALLAYWQARNPTHPQRGHPSKLKSVSELPLHWTLGREIGRDDDLLRAGRAFADGRAPASRTGWRLLRRFCVRGHFRAQACGAGRAQRRVIFVEPYWKGPRDGVGLRRVFGGGEGRKGP